MKICLAMPSKGHEEFVQDAVRSVLSAWPVAGELEFRILDAGTGEATLEGIRVLISGFEGARLDSRPDAGQADALRRCFAETDADVLGWLNADDLLLSGALDHVLDCFEKEERTDVLYGNALFVDERGHCTGAYPVSGFDAELLKSFCFISQPSTFFRRSIYAQVGGIDPDLNFALDYDLWLRFLKVGARFSRTDRILSATRLHQSTKTDTGGPKFTREVIECQARVFPGEAAPERAAWKRYRRGFCQGMNRAIAFLEGMFAGGPLRELPARLTWGLKISVLYCKAWVRARQFSGRAVEI